LSHRSAAGLYDALHTFESRYRKGNSYPVHKRLVFDDASIHDVYDWIIAEVGLPDDGTILDAGCGVGFGTIRMAEQCSGRVRGISISPAEIATARRSAVNSPARTRVAFELADFEALPANSYDLIVAVESLKHSEDLPTTLETMAAALRQGGQLVIVEDCYSGAHDNTDAAELIANWGLARLFSEADYIAGSNATATRVVDLDRYVRTAGPLTRARRRIASGLRRFLGRVVDPRVAAAFAGGAYLDRLYDAGHMHYKAIFVATPGGMERP